MTDTSSPGTKLHPPAAASPKEHELMTTSPTGPDQHALSRRVVRKHDSGTMHVADVHPDQFHVARWMGSAFIAAELPLATVCGVVLRGDVAVCMKGGTKVSCVRCRRLAATERAPEGNECLAGFTGAELWDRGASA